MLHILSKEGATPRVSGFFFKGDKKAVLILGGETGVFTPRMGKALGGFQTQMAIRLTVKLPHRTTDGTWKYISAEAVRVAAGFLTMEEYIRRSQNTFTRYIAMRNCLACVRGQIGLLRRDSGCGGENRRELNWQGPRRQHQQ